MKNIIGLLLGLVVVAFSCTNPEAKPLTMKTYELEVTYANGDKDTLFYKGIETYLDKGDLKVVLHNNYYTKVVASGVRSYKILK